MLKIPSTKTHYDITKRLLGKEHPEVHAIIDGSVKVKRSELSKKTSLIDPSSHRKDFVHRKEFWDLLFMMGKINNEQLMAAYLHFLSDTIDTKGHHILDDLINPRWRLDRYKAKLLS